MVVEDAFTVPGLGLVVTGRPERDIRAGERLWLVDAGVRYEVAVVDVRHFCLRGFPAGLAPAGINVGLVIAGTPSDLDLRGHEIVSE
jgi:selenocysteine-specific translation elongation factor